MHDLLTWKFNYFKILQHTIITEWLKTTMVYDLGSKRLPDTHNAFAYRSEWTLLECVGCSGRVSVKIFDGTIPCDVYRSDKTDNILHENRLFITHLLCMEYQKRLSNTLLLFYPFPRLITCKRGCLLSA